MVAVLGIVCALPAEARVFTKTWGPVGEVFPLTPRVFLVQAGVGPRRAGIAGQRLLNQGANALLSWGCAGALDARLKAGDLLLPKTVMTMVEPHRVLRVDAAWQHRLWSRLSSLHNLYDGKLVSSGKVVASPAEKRWLATRSGALAVDMESAALGILAQRANVPFVAVRAVADTAQMSLPSQVLSVMDPSGRVPLGRFLANLLYHPRDMPILIQLWRSLRAAQRSLVEVFGRTGPGLLWC